MIKQEEKDFYIRNNVKYENKQDYIIVSGIYKTFKDRLNTFIYSDLPFPFDIYYNYNYYKDIIPTKSDFDICFKVYNNVKCRRYRYTNRVIEWEYLRNKCQEYQDYNIIFVTLTFSDLFLNSLSYATRREYVTRFLHNNFIDYLGNLDFGALNQREHYHALVFTNKTPQELKNTWKYGFDAYVFTYIVLGAKNYLLKLCNHSFKQSTKLSRVITPFRRKINIPSKIVEISGRKFPDFYIYRKEYKSNI